MHPRARILVVEDESVVALDIQDRLQALEYHVVGRAATGEQAIHLALEHLPDLILMDIKLKGEMDGVEAAERIRALADIPVVFLTAFADAQTLQRAQPIEPFGYILKPFEERDLFAQIEIALYKHKMERALRESQERYELAVQGSKDGIWDWDLRSGKIYLSPRWKGMLGYLDFEIGDDPQEWFGRVHPQDLGRLQAEIANHIQGQSAHVELECRLKHRNGDWMWVLIRGLGVRDTSGRAYRLSGSLTDITPLKMAEERGLSETLYDSLTGLPNRTFLLQRLAQILESNNGSPAQDVGLVYLDIDNFCMVNDYFGYALGDRMLKQVARRLVAHVDDNHMAARLSGDEFCFLLLSVSLPDAIAFADRILESFKTPFVAGDGTNLSISTSIGIVHLSTANCQPSSLLQCAEMAMYQAKSVGKGCRVLYDPSFHQQLLARLEMENRLRQALELREFQVYYQPIIHLEDQHLVGVEALLRWFPAGREPISPRLFIPLAEETGLSIPIGEWAMRQACQQARWWQENYPQYPPLQLHVNLSPRQLTHPHLPETMEHILQDSGFPADCLHLEITDSVVLADWEQVHPILNKLNMLGAKISLDDFGIGYSSLSYLQKLEIQGIKLDRSFIDTIDGNQKGAEIVKAILHLAQGLGIQVIAEGIETNAEWRQLRELSCTIGQGFLFYPPLDSAAAEKLLSLRFITPD